jgi:hypothetical protein
MVTVLKSVTRKRLVENVTERGHESMCVCVCVCVTVNSNGVNQRQLYDCL